MKQLTLLPNGSKPKLMIYGKKTGVFEMSTTDLVKRAALNSFIKFRPNIPAIDGYVGSNQENLLTDVMDEDFVKEFEAGGGRELVRKFRAVHSSAALTVNSFARFKRNRKELTLPMGDNFRIIAFEEKCPTGLRGEPPNIDVFLENESIAIGIESKFTEHLSHSRGEFSGSYNQLRDMDYIREMKRFNSNPSEYYFLDVAQLIKDSFGLVNNFGHKRVVLLYIYWEPSNVGSLSNEHQHVFDTHREEVQKFSNRVTNLKPEFVAMTYNELWQYWRKSANHSLKEHIDELEARYNFPI